MWLAWLLVIASACGRVNFDPLVDASGNGDGGSGSGSGSDGGGTGASCMGGNPSCVSTAGSLNLAGTYNASNSTASLGNGQAGSCGGANANEFTVQLIVMAAGTYQFTTAGSSFDTVLYILDACGGSELACSNSGGTAETLAMPLAQGQRIVVVVDGADACGTFQFRAGAAP